jgi:FtsP/CotA-like multicopper oxidase with cupredoxin domain
MKFTIAFFTLALFALAGFTAIAQTDTTTYHLSQKQETVSKAGKKVIGMTINGQIPGPTLHFTEGDYAVMYVKNDMDVQTSVHWHGMLLPNFFDGVPYLNTPPIMPGETQKYEFLIKQAGTYWYHSHTMLQEQSGVYGALVIEPREKTLQYDRDLVLVLSDWTNEKPKNIMRFLKRGTEWYSIKKGTATPLNQVIAQGALGAQLNFWKQRMEGADIADIYYDAFLINGEKSQEYPEFLPGEIIRLRVVNAASSTSFWLSIGDGNPILVAADGLAVDPFKTDKLFIAVAETYDFLVSIPKKGKIEFRATGQDGSGQSSAFIGTGQAIQAMDIPKPDKIKMMQQMAKMDMRMGAPAIKFNPKQNDPQAMRKNWGMKMDGMQDMEMDDKSMFSEYNYDFLKSTVKTTYPENIPVNEILLNLTGNMQRYIWSMNGIPLAETDKIKIKKGEVTRITFNNLTMMHHPMHLHGHFFRVINENDDYSPLKHTVNVAPMQQVTIEFYGNEYGDWFFHCHILYHMMGGMARIFSYDTPRDMRLKNFPVSKLIHESSLKRSEQKYGFNTTINCS